MIPENLKKKYLYYFKKFEYVSFENNKLYFYDIKKDIAESILEIRFKKLLKKIIK